VKGGAKAFWRYRRASGDITYSRNFFSNRVVEAWNMVPGVIKRSQTVSSFKNAYRRHRKNMVEIA
jgi:hypothetical protein